MKIIKRVRPPYSIDHNHWIFAEFDNAPGYNEVEKKIDGKPLKEVENIILEPTETPYNLALTMNSRYLNPFKRPGIDRMKRALMKTELELGWGDRLGPGNKRVPFVPIEIIEVPDDIFELMMHGMGKEVKEIKENYNKCDFNKERIAAFYMMWVYKRLRF